MGKYPQKQYLGPFGLSRVLWELHVGVMRWYGVSWAFEVAQRLLLRLSEEVYTWTPKVYRIIAAYGFGAIFIPSFGGLGSA